MESTGCERRPGEPLRPLQNWLWVIVAIVAAAYPLSAAVAYCYTSSDLTQDYLSARALRDRTSVYAPLPAAWAHEGDERLVTNDHPPPYIVALSPLALLPYPAAFLSLAAANVAAAAAAAVLIARALGWSVRAAALTAAGLLVHPGTLACASVGNISLLLFLAVVLGWRAARRDRTGVAGGWLGLAAGVKLYPALLVAALVAGRSRRGAVWAVLVGVACWAGAAMAVGLADVRTYAGVRVRENAGEYVGHGFNLSVAGAAHRAFGRPSAHSPWLERAADRPEWADALAWAGRAAVGALIAVGLLRARHEPDYPDRAFTALVPGMLLLSPLTWLHAVPMMALPVALLARAETGFRRVALAGCTGAMFLNDRWAAVQWVALTGEGVSPAMNVVLLAPMWGMLGVLLLGVTARRTAEEGPARRCGNPPAAGPGQAAADPARDIASRDS